MSEGRKLENVEKLVCSIEDKEKYFIHIRVLKHALNHGLVLSKVYRVIKFNKGGWAKSYIDMNTKLRNEAKNEFEKDFFKLMNNSVFEKAIENVRKDRDIKLVTTEEQRIKLVSEPNYHTTKQFSENFLAIERKKTKVKMNKPVYLIALKLTFSLKIFLKILITMLKDGLIHLTMTRMMKNHFQSV